MSHSIVVRPWFAAGAVAICCFVGLTEGAVAQFNFGPGVLHSSFNLRLVDCCDLDDDGFDDIVGEETVLFSNGDGTFGNALVVGMDVHALADLDGDGDMDLVGRGAVPGMYGLGVVFNSGNRVFSPPLVAPVPIPLGVIQVGVGDLNGDGAPDAFVASEYTSAPFTGAAVFLNDGLGGLMLHSTFPSVGTTRPPMLGDLDGDGDDDVVFVVYGDYSIMMNQGAAVLSAPSTPQALFPAGANRSRSVELQDLDGDGLPEVVAGAGRDLFNSLSAPFIPSQVLIVPNVGGVLGSPNSLFLTPTTIGPGGSPVADVHVGDLNGNGMPDIMALRDSSPPLVLFENLGAGTFGPEQAQANSMSNSGLIADGDFDGDGDRDLIVQSSGNDFSIHMNLGPPPASPYPGSLEDLDLSMGVNAPPLLPATTFVQDAAPGDALTLRLISPGGSFAMDPFAVIAQVFNTGLPPAPNPIFPSVQLDPAQAIVVFDGFASPSGPIGLPHFGFNLAGVAPPGHAGLSLLVQGFAFSPTANNGLFAVSSGCEIQFL